MKSFRFFAPALLFVGFVSVGLFAAEARRAPTAPPTFAVSGLSIEGDELVVRFKATYPSGTVGTWDPEAAKNGVPRLVTVEGGKWVWITYKPELRDATPPPPPPPPPDKLIELFTVEPTSIRKGEVSKLTWSCPKAKTVMVNGLSVASSGEQSLKPDVTTTYTLVATDGAKTDTAQRILTVSDLPPPPPPPPPSVGLNVALIAPDPHALRNLSPEQVAIPTSRAFRDYTDKNCEKQEDGKTPAYAALLRSNDNSNLSPRWREILDKTPKDKVILAARKGNKYFVGDLPANLQASLKVLADVSGVPAGPVVPFASPRLREIPDGDWVKYNPPPGLDGHRVVDFGGEKRYLSAKPRDLKKHPVGSLSFAKPLSAYGINLIPRSEWQGRIAALKAANAGLMPLTYHIPPYDQNGTNYCWCNCVAQGMVAAMYEMGHPLRIISAASIGGPVSNYRNEGGWPAEAVKFAMATGAVRVELWPSNAISATYARKSEVKADYPKNRISATLADLGEQAMFDEVATCVLLGAPTAVSYNWWSHAVLAVGLEYQNGKYYLVIRNSWGEYEDHGFFLLPEGRGSKRGTPDDAQAILGLAA